jgi:hypothetical protein
MQGWFAPALLVFDRPPTLTTPKPMQNSLKYFWKKLDPCFKFPWISLCSLQQRRATLGWRQRFDVLTESAWGGQEKNPGAGSFRLCLPNSVISPCCCITIPTCASAINESPHAHRKTTMKVNLLGWYYFLSTKADFFRSLGDRYRKAIFIQTGTYQYVLSMYQNNVMYAGPS